MAAQTLSTRARSKQAQSIQPRPTHAARRTPAEPSPRLVPAVERAVKLLDALAGSRRPASLAQLARELDAPKSSVHGLLSTLVELDLVRRNDAGEMVATCSTSPAARALAHSR